MIRGSHLGASHPPIESARGILNDITKRHLEMSDLSCPGPWLVLTAILLNDLKRGISSDAWFTQEDSPKHLGHQPKMWFTKPFWYHVDCTSSLCIRSTLYPHLDHLWSSSLIAQKFCYSGIKTHIINNSAHCIFTRLTTLRSSVGTLWSEQFIYTIFSFDLSLIWVKMRRAIEFTSLAQSVSNDPLGNPESKFWAEILHFI